jgi:hypothetical protein
MNAVTTATLKRARENLDVMLVASPKKSLLLPNARNAAGRRAPPW